MGKASKYLILFLIFDAVIVAGYFGLKAIKGGRVSVLDAYDWVTIDEAYVPKNEVEAFIKTDAENRGALPVYIKKYGANTKVLGLFKGKQYAQPSLNTLKMLNRGLDDWMIVEIKYQTEAEREVIRTLLYLFVQKQWKVGDTGTLIR
jgi:hypothetical protein